MTTVQQLAQQYINDAQRNPHRAPEILRNAAAHFAQLASQPANRGTAHKLTTIGLDFAGAAMAHQAQAQQVQAQEEYQPPTTDDFTQLLRETHQANIELGPDAMATTHAAMDSMAQRRGNETEDANGVSVQPRTFLNMDTTLGRTAKIKFRPTDEEKLVGVKESETVAFWQGRKQESQAMSLDFGLALPPAIFIGPEALLLSPPVVDCRLFSIIQYGADGNTQNQVTIDLRLGQRINVLGNYISVLVGMEAPRHYEPTGTDETIGITVPTVVVGASIGTFASPTTAPVTRTVYIDQLAASTPTQGIPIPQRAVALLPPVAATTTDTLSIEFLTFNGTPIGTWQSVYSPNTPFWVPYPLPTDAYFFRVTSSTGVPFVSPLLGGRNGLRIPFQLSL